MNDASEAKLLVPSRKITKLRGPRVEHWSTMYTNQERYMLVLCCARPVQYRSLQASAIEDSVHTHLIVLILRLLFLLRLKKGHCWRRNHHDGD